MTTSRGRDVSTRRRRRKRHITVYLLQFGPRTRRGRLGTYFWDISAAWRERLMPRPTLLWVVLRDICRGRRR